MDAEELQRSLRRAARLLDPPRRALLDDVAGAYALRMPEAELAEVTFDSRTAPTRVRGGTRVRLLTFGTSALTVDVELTPGPSGHLLVGQLTPGGPATVVVRGPRPATAQRSAEADDLGRFGLSGLAPGPFSLVVRSADASALPVATDWIVL